MVVFGLSAGVWGGDWLSEGGDPEEGGHEGPLLWKKSGAVAGGVEGSEGIPEGVLGVLPPPRKRLTPFMVRRKYAFYSNDDDYDDAQKLEWSTVWRVKRDPEAARCCV